MNYESAQRWLDDYVAAWVSYDPADIGALFSDDIAYRYHPHDEPIRGRDAVVASWVDDEADDGAGDGSEVESSRDDPGTFDARYHPVAVDGAVVVARGASSYRDVAGGPIVRIYDNVFLLRFDSEGRCEEFTEFYTRRPFPEA
ncbi:nuclear transport factor 2 family protein [Rhodoglobus sp.]